MRTPILRRLAAVVVAFALALFCVPALVAFAVGENVTVQVIGPAADGSPAQYAPATTYQVAEGEDAWTLSQRLFDDSGLTYDAENSTYGVLLNSINSPVDGATLAYNEESGAYWQLFVDGVASEVGISGVELADGMQIVWYYSAFGDELPTEVAPLEAAAPDAAPAAAPAEGQASFPVIPVVLVAAAACAGVAFFLNGRKNA